MSHVSWPCLPHSTNCRIWPKWWGIPDISAHPMQNQWCLFWEHLTLWVVPNVKHKGTILSIVFVIPSTYDMKKWKRWGRARIMGKKQKEVRHLKKWIWDKKFVSSHILYVDNKFILPISPTPKKKSCFCPNDPFYSINYLPGGSGIGLS